MTLACLLYKLDLNDLWDNLRELNSAFHVKFSIPAPDTALACLITPTQSISAQAFIWIAFLYLSLLKFPEVADLHKRVLERGQLMTGLANEYAHLFPRVRTFRITHATAVRSHHHHLEIFYWPHNHPLPFIDRPLPQLFTLSFIQAVNFFLVFSVRGSCFIIESWTNQIKYATIVPYYDRMRLFKLMLRGIDWGTFIAQTYWRTHIALTNSATFI